MGFSKLDETEEVFQFLSHVDHCIQCQFALEMLDIYVQL